MDPKRWDKGVELELGKTGNYRVVITTSEAAEILLNRWPAEAGQAHLHARIACVAVLNGHASPDHARDAFIRAAEEAGIFIRSK
ncbi:DUF982 domain-containing protein [Rhizobium sp. ARZ01]|uniref:DUF982 domain-containing protein n=1 Tax=Rhizobium sp. ARZ01 TaxID=2769313 RepID=UPI0017866061|nr:DUF982 domain-containing protein [Rhizobium sp. ARZ01]MBD9375469.1 DUF982 domain-containing protein [Rhizobium sp. ARZ01]